MYKVRIGIYRTEIRPSDHDTVTMSGQCLDIARYQESRPGFRLANCESLGTVIGNISRIFPSFIWIIFTHVMHLDQSRSSENI